MSRTKLTAPGRELVIDREVIAIEYMDDMDGSWTYTDRSGHRHHCVYEGPDYYPTLVRVYDDEAWWCETCRDDHQDSHLECRQCTEVIIPGRTGPGTKYIQGLVTCTFNGEPISTDDAMAMVAEWEHTR